MSFVEVRNLKKNYKDFLAVKGISFDIQEGQSFGLLGPNGAGKTTTISMLATLLEPSEGDIIVGGYSIKDDPKKVKELLGYVPQDIALYPTLNAEENLIFWGRMYGLKGAYLRERVKDVLEIVSLTDKAKNKIETYSGGMKRRINIAVGLLHKPRLLLMDEPTVGVDPQSRNNILETVKELNKRGMAIIYTSHYMEEVEFLCQKVAIMDNGEIKGMGTVEELKELVGNKDMVKIQSLQNITSEQGNKLTEHFNSSLQIQNRELSLVVANGSKELASILSIIQQIGIEITAVDVQKPNLEKVFLHLTGKSLRD